MKPLLPLLLLAVAVPADAQITQFVVCVRNQGGQFCNQGTGVPVGKLAEDSYVFVTSGHHLDGGSLVSAKASMKNGDWAPATLLGRNLQGSDLSVWAVQTTAKIETYPVADSLDGIKTVKHIGFNPDNGQWTGRTEQIVSIDKDLITDKPARSGHSGGPLLTQDGCVAGIIWGTDDRRTYAVPAKQVCLTLQMFCPGYRCGCRPKVPPPPAGSDKPDLPSPIDYDLLADKLMERIRADAERFRGPKGDAGEPGKDGDPGSPGNSGVVRVVIEDSQGNILQQTDGVQVGQVVHVPIRRFLKE